jgi:hypothetical protein
MGVLLMDAGLACLAVGLVSLLKPLRFLGIRTRRRAAAVAAAGALLTAGAVAWPAPLLRSARRPSRLDDFVPRYQFDEHHEILVHAAPERVWWAVKTVTAEEITFFRTLTWLRNPRRSWRPAEENILAPRADRPILDTALSSGFVLLAEEPNRELVVGTLVIAPRRPPPGAHFAAISGPGHAKAALNFHVEPQGGGDGAEKGGGPGGESGGGEEGTGWSLLSTETRVFATDPVTRRRFAAYWRVIYPGSALIRIEWLRAIRRRAEGPISRISSSRPPDRSARLPASSSWPM